MRVLFIRYLLGWLAVRFPQSEVDLSVFGTFSAVFCTAEAAIYFVQRGCSSGFSATVIWVYATVRLSGLAGNECGLHC